MPALSLATLRHRALLLMELVVLFVLPGVVHLAGVRFTPIPVLVVAAVCAIVALWRDPTFDRRRLWNAECFSSRLLGVVSLAAFAALLLGFAVWLVVPERWLALPLRHPRLWVLILVLYPLASVYPQELVYRAFFFHRYHPLFGDGPKLWLASAGVFAWVHIIFGNVLAVALTLPGGLLFAWRYHRTRSLLVTSVEHAIYGQILFTIGLGEFFYHGASRLLR